MTRFSPHVRFIPKGIVPTYEQSQIQLSQKRISLIEAGAGTAKTTTLALRVGEALRRGLPPEQILVWVFTEEAATVFAQRLVRLGVSSALLKRLNISTVEDFARSLWRQWDGESPPYYKRLADLEQPILLALEDCSQRYLEQYPYLDIRHHAAAISQFFVNQLCLKQSLAWFAEDSSLTAQERADLLGVPLADYLWAKCYERLRISAFGEAQFRGPYDASYDLAQSLYQDPGFKQNLPSYRLIIVDELHDMNACAFYILKALLAHAKSYLVAAGDSDQVIYSHMGADKRYLHEYFEAHFSYVSHFKLSYSFRYGPWLALCAGAFKNKTLASALAFDTQVVVSHYEPGQQPDILLQAIAHTTKQPGQHLGQCAVILRAMHQSVVIENALLMAGVPYQCQGFVPYLQRDEILFIRSLLALALSKEATLAPKTLKAMVQALNLYGEAHLSPKALIQVTQDVVQSPNILRYFYDIRLVEKNQPAVGQRNQKAMAILQTYGAQSSAAKALFELYACLDIEALAKRIYLDTEQAEIIAASIYGLITLAQSQRFTLAQLHQWMTKADAFIEQGVCFIPKGSQRAQPQHVLTLMCAAQAKGTEYPYVFLPFLAQGEFPRANEQAFIEENLFYVACTRAQAKLHLFMPTRKEKQSPYIQRLQIEKQRPTALSQLSSLQQRLTRQKRPAQQPHTPRAPAHKAQAHKAPRLKGVQKRIYIQVPFAEKDEAKAMGAYWDPHQRSWYIPHWVAPEPLLSRWPKRDKK